MGEKLHTRLRLNEAGIPVELRTTGRDYFGNAVDEEFALRDGRATWRNRVESGERPVTGTPLYRALHDASDLTIIAEALIRAPESSLPLLPDGSARLERVGELRVRREGEALTVVQYHISGLWYAPDPVWFDDQSRFLAHVHPWHGVVQEGWESVVVALLDAQDVAARALEQEQARTLRRRPQGPVMFRNVRVFDAEIGHTRAGISVVVAGNRIQQVAPDASISVPDSATVIDGTGKTLLPGLWDMHGHIDSKDGLLHLAAGVTTVRDVGNDTTTGLRLRRAWTEGMLPERRSCRDSGICTRTRSWCRSARHCIWPPA